MQADNNDFNEILRKLNLLNVNWDSLHSGNLSFSSSFKEWESAPNQVLHSKLSPINGAFLYDYNVARPREILKLIEDAKNAFEQFRLVPAPRRGEFVRRIGNKFRENKELVAKIIVWETGKIEQEALGEVQEVIDICDFAVGLSRQMYGNTMPSERVGHRLQEQWHPVGPVGVITAFNFPAAVWAWNAAIALVCGNTVIWKPSEKAIMTAAVCHKLATSVLEEMPDIPSAVINMIFGSWTSSDILVDSESIPLISFTGSSAVGLQISKKVASRFGKCILELGGNNAAIVTPSADLDLTIRSVVFSAVGTAGQRCTSLRRLIVHESIAAEVLKRLCEAYKQVLIGNPFHQSTLVGPLIDKESLHRAYQVIQDFVVSSSLVYGGNRIYPDSLDGGYYLEPTIIACDYDNWHCKEETFAPILYFHTYKTIEQAIMMNNSVPQGLSSAIFSNDIRETELFCSAAGSDCGIVNVNTGTSGAEIGGAFGGEKATGGGRESGSDAWKQYMRRVTTTINYSSELPLAQGINFNV